MASLVQGVQLVQAQSALSISDMMNPSAISTDVAGVSDGSVSGPGVTGQSTINKQRV